MFWNKKVEKPKRAWKELLRENLGTVSVDMFYGKDPLLSIPEGERMLYLKKFHDVVNDKDIMGRILYLVNQQANLTLKTMKDGNSDDENMGGAMNINGICLVKDDFERLASMHTKEGDPPKEFNPYAIV